MDIHEWGLLSPSIGALSVAQIAPIAAQPTAPLPSAKEAFAGQLPECHHRDLEQLHGFDEPLPPDFVPSAPLAVRLKDWRMQREVDAEGSGALQPAWVETDTHTRASNSARVRLPAAASDPSGALPVAPTQSTRWTRSWMQSSRRRPRGALVLQERTVYPESELPNHHAEPSPRRCLHSGHEEGFGPGEPGSLTESARREPDQ